jgi:gliding motility-associated-like protein
MGADLTYECVGGNNYKIRVSFYRDCIGINAPTNVNVTISSASCGQSFIRTLNPIPGTGVEITPLCPNALSTCRGGVFTGIQEWIYEAVVTLPMQCTDWTFSYQLCCRNGAINTITSPLTNTFYIYATLNNTVSPCNSSPVFSNKPVPFACLGQQLCFNHGASDADGDSLVYELITPKQNATTNVSYIAPFSATNPLSSNPAVSFNTATGDICMTPTQLDVTVMAVLVKEYRNGVLIGTVERDIQVTVINCNNNLPTLTGINGTNVFSATICANQPYCFNIYSNDPDAGQNLTLSYDSSITGASFTSAGSPHPTGTFCWTPTNADISSTPRCFTVKVTDDNCPWLGSQIYSYCLTVTGVNVNAGPDQYVTCSDLATITATPSGGTGGPYTYQWSNGFTNPTQTVGPGTYIVTVSDGMCSATDTVAIHFISFPTAAFSYSSACLNASVSFTDQSTVSGSTIIGWYWNFGDGSTSTTQNPTHTYTATGTYNVMLVVETNLGCLDTIMQPITIQPLPQPVFTISAGCTGSAVNIVNSTTGNIVAWNWNFGNGQSSGQQNPTIVYADSGNYTVTLQVTDSNGCQGIATGSVQIEPAPVASFNITGQATCQGGQFTVNNTSSGNIISYSWNFGNGQTSVLQNPSIVFSNPGVYPVTLSVTSANGCISTYTQNVTISPLPVANAGPDLAVCVGQAITVTASGGITYQWSNGQSGNSINVSPVTATTYTVTVTDINGCTAIDSMVVHVNPLPNIVLSPDQSICEGASANLTASGGVSYFWTPLGSSSSNVTVSPNVSTTYGVSVTDANGCTSNGFVNVMVHTNPVVNIPSTFVCPGTTTTLNAGNSGATYQWSTGEATSSILVSAPGNYTVTVTNNYGCSSSQTVQVVPGGSITNNNANQSICQGETVTLDAGNPGNSYLWSNGSTNQTIVVSVAGQYAVTITNSNGCSATLTTTLNVNPLPQAAFTPTDVCLNQSVNFNDISTITSGNIIQWQWSFGDGNVSQQQNPVHNFSNPGSYSANLIVWSNAGCVDTVYKTIQVFPPPQVDFTTANGCLGTSILFNNLSTTSAGNITSYNWSFGDGANASSISPSHVFSYSGTFDVILTVSSSGGCVDSMMHTVAVYPLPVADFSSAPVCLNQPSVFINNSNVSGNTINQWNWDFGNGTLSQVQNPSVYYATAGMYQVQLIVKTSNNCTDTISKPVVVHALPNADAGNPQSVCLGNQVTLNASGGNVFQWTPVQANSASVTITPTVSQTYYVVVTDSNQCSNSDSVLITVLQPPVADAGVNQQTCLGNSVVLQATGGSSYFWSPTSQTSSSISVAPLSSTMFYVTVTAPNGCSAMDSVWVKINPLPTALAGPDQNLCSGLTTMISASGGVSYSWYPTGDTTAIIYVNPSTTTHYVVEVTDSNGCSAKDTIMVNVLSSPTVVLNNAFICQGYNTTLNAGNAGATYLWMPNGETSQTIQVSAAGTYGVVVTAPNGCTAFDDAMITVGGDSIINSSVNTVICSGQTAQLNAGNPGATYQWSTGATTQTISVSAAGTYTVTITDAGGCSSIFDFPVVVNPLPAPSFLASPLCLGNTTQFNNQSSISSGNIISYLWDFGDGASSAQSNPSHLYALSGTYLVSLQATSGNGCYASVSVPVQINALPVVSATAANVCQGHSVGFINNSTSAGGAIQSWLWNFGDGSTDSIQAPLHSYQLPGTYQVSLTAVNASGCVDSTHFSILVHPEPVVSFNINNICNGGTVMPANQTTMAYGNVVNYSWNFGDGYTDTGFQPVHQYSQPGNYSVVLTALSDSGCQSSATVPVQIFPNPVASFTAMQACQEAMVHITNQSSVANGTISNYYWSFGDGFATNDSIPVHQYSQSGNQSITLVVTSDNGCTDTVQHQVVIHPLPVAGFTGNAVCQNTSLQLTDTSSVISGNIISWNWQFGNTSVSSLQNPIVVFNTSGSVLAQLIVVTDQGCSDTIVSNINVYSLPTPSFTANDVCLGTDVAFYNQSSVSGGATFTCYWNFGDGFTDSTNNTTHQYLQSGNYNVTLNVITNTGCSASISQPVSIYEPPLARFTAASVCKNQPTVFNDQSTSVNGLIVSWNWDFGDGATSQSKNPLHTYQNDGSYPVELRVMSSRGCADVYNDTVSIFRLPQPQIFTTNNCVNIPITMIDVSDTSNNQTTNWLWNFGDGNSSADPSPQHTYQHAGTYVITLQTTNDNGCKAVDTIMVEAFPLPVAAFTGGPGCEGAPVSFQNQSTIATGVIAYYNWNFGDSTTSNTINPVHTFNTAGTYSVSLVAMSDQGCTDTAQAVIVIHHNPVAQFQYTNHAGCGPLPVQFYDYSQSLDGNIVAWNWNFGDGHSDTLQNPVNIYYQSGVYNVSLTVTSEYGCVNTDTASNAIVVYPSPIAAFTPDPRETNILNPVINFINQSSGMTTWNWDLGDGYTTTEFEPTHAYGDTGWYNVGLIVINSFGCRDTAYDKVYIAPITTFYIPNAFTPNNDGTNEIFDIKGINIINYTLMIHDRWGELLFEGDNQGWDGRVKNKSTQAKQDVYVYTVVAKDVFGKIHKMVGHVTLLR